MYACGENHSRSAVLVALTLLALLSIALLSTLLRAQAEASETSVLTVCPAGPPGCDFSEIQAAVNQASNGDAIKIAAGVYDSINDLGGLPQVVYISKTLTITGGYNAAFSEPPNPETNQTVIDAQGQGRALYVAEGAEVSVSGVRFTGGDANGLGPECDEYSCTDYGAGIFVNSATFALLDSEVYGNMDNSGEDSYWLLGGGLAAREANVVVDGVQFHDNEATWGGGLAIYNGEALVRNSEFSRNSGKWGGGCWLCQGGVTVMFTGNTVAHNVAEEGGGLFTCASDVDIFLVGNVILGNRAAQGGGLAVQFGSNVTMANNVIRENEADAIGSGFYADGGASLLVHTTIAGNRGAAGSGIHLDGGSVVLTNTIVAEQSVGIYAAADSAVYLEATLWGSGDLANAFDWWGAGTIVTGTVNVWGDPSFTTDGYHIMGSSAAIDAGVDIGMPTDIDGNLRPHGSAVDIGAVEYTLDEVVYLPVMVR